MAMVTLEGEYGWSQMDDTPTRPELTDAEKAKRDEARRITGTAFMKKSGLSVDELNTLVQSHGFPGGVRKQVGGGYMFPKYDVVYDREAIAAWQERSAFLARAINAKF
jgi:hypothetical protein